MMRNRTLLLLVAAAAFCISSPATADILVNFEANLDPFQEVPPHNTPAYGSVDATLNLTTNIFSVTAGTGLYADLLAGATTVRLQDAPVGMTGPTLALLNLDTPGNTSGTFSGSSGALTMAQVSDLEAGSGYINIADSVFPSGEIRGQLGIVAPEPSSLVLAGMAALGMLAAAWRRKAA